MTVVFLGTPEFAVPSLQAVLQSSHRVLAVVSQPDRETDKKGNLKPTPVKAFAALRGIPVYQFDQVSKEGLPLIRSLKPDIMVTAAFGQILSDEFLSVAPVYNVHASLLPRHRGSSPIQAAILEGDKETGITVMKTVRAMDAGDIILQGKTAIGKDEPYFALHNRLGALGAELIVKALDRTERGEAVPLPQDATAATYTKKVTKADGLIDWADSAEIVARKIRAFNPWPSAYTRYGSDHIKIIEGKSVDFSTMRDILSEIQAKPGEVLFAGDPYGLIVRCGEGAIRILALQASGKKVLGAAEFLRGYPLKAGTRFGIDGDVRT